MAFRCSTVVKYKIVLCIQDTTAGRGLFMKQCFDIVASRVLYNYLLDFQKVRDELKVYPVFVISVETSRYRVYIYQILFVI